MFEINTQLLRQINLGEDSVLEFKDINFSGGRVSGPTKNDFADELSAMANAFGGVCLLGVDDKTRMITGIASDKLDVVETWVRNLCNDSIKPQLFCKISKQILTLADGTEKNVVRIDVPQSLFVHKSPGGYFQRLGSSKREMQPEVLARLFQQRSQSRLIRFDESEVQTAPVDSIKSELWEKFKSPVLSIADPMEYLMKLKLVTNGLDGQKYPTVSGILMATEHPEIFLPCAYIQAVAYRGTERNAMYQDNAEDICGPLDIQIYKAYHFVKRNMKTFAIKSPGRIDIPQYSLAAVFEAIVNAVAHRDYSIIGAKIRIHIFSNRLEIYSPGMIPNTMTIDSMPLRQYSRNELLTSLLARCPLSLDTKPSHRITIMDKRGEGVPIILSESEKLSGKKPEYRLLEDELLLTIYPACPEEYQR